MRIKVYKQFVNQLLSICHLRAGPMANSPQSDRCYIALWAVVSGCCGILLGRHVRMFDREVHGRQLNQIAQAPHPSAGDRAIVLLERMMGLKPVHYQHVQAWLDAHPAVPHDAPYYDRSRDWVPPQGVAVRDHPVHKGRLQLQSAFIAMHTFMWVGGLLPISPWGHRRTSFDMDKSVIGRWGFTRYFKSVAGIVPKGARCLSWEQKHAQLVAACDVRHTWQFNYRAIKRGAIAQANEATRTLHSEYAPQSF